MTVHFIPVLTIVLFQREMDIKAGAQLIMRSYDPFSANCWNELLEILIFLHTYLGFDFIVAKWPRNLGKRDVKSSRYIKVNISIIDIFHCSISKIV